MSERAICVVCSKDCARHHLYCDIQEGPWCPGCFDKTPCGQGKHGEGCPTQVFSDEREQQDAA